MYTCTCPESKTDPEIDLEPKAEPNPESESDTESYMHAELTFAIDIKKHKYKQTQCIVHAM